jgi:hypothetical protein
VRTPGAEERSPAVPSKNVTHGGPVYFTNAHVQMTDMATTDGDGMMLRAGTDNCGGIRYAVVHEVNRKCPLCWSPPHTSQSSNCFPAALCSRGFV